MTTNETYKVTLRKFKSTWYYFTENPQGGGSGSNYCGPKHIAFHRATMNIPIGATIILTVETEKTTKTTTIEAWNI